MTRKRGINWFRFNRELHRDVGYFCIGLTLVFAISGIALNHVGDWNPNYIVERVEHPIDFENSLADEKINQRLLLLFVVDEPIKATYWESPMSYKVFFKEGGSISVNFLHHKAVFEHIRERVMFKQFNRLHLNEAKQGWIVFSDIYAGLLIFLSLSALFMVKGKYSPWRLRRGWLVILGALIPAVYIFL